MQVTELFPSQLEEAIKKNPHGNIADFLPDIHDSLPEIQENLFYICAGGRRTLYQMEQYSFSDIEGYLLLYTHEGRGIMEVSGDSRNLEEGDMLLWDCADFIQLRALSEKWKVDILFFNGNAVITYYEEICKISFPVPPALRTRAAARISYGYKHNFSCDKFRTLIAVSLLNSD